MSDLLPFSPLTDNQLSIREEHAAAMCVRSVLSGQEEYALLDAIVSATYRDALMGRVDGRQEARRMAAAYALADQHMADAKAAAGIARDRRAGVAMMCGPEHYREAERLLGEANAAPGRVAAAKPHASGEVVLTMIGNLIAEAQVHATLALAAATARPSQDQDAWVEVTA